MTHVVVDLDRLTGLIDRMAAFERHLVGAHAQVAARVADLRASWTGEAAYAQAAATNEWSSALGEVHTALAALRRIGTAAHANYAAASTANRRMWAQ